MKHLPKFKQLTLALAAAAFLPCTVALAAPVITVAGSSAASANGVAGTPTDYSTPPSYSGSYTFTSNTAGEGSGSGWASSGGAYAVRSSSAGVGTGNGNAQFRYLLVNDTGVAQNYTMSFHIYGGAIGTYLADTLTGLETAGAAYQASISVGGVQQFLTSAQISRNAAGVQFSGAGTALSADDTSDGVYSWGSSDVLVNIGFLAAGESIEIVADVTDSSYSNVGTYTYTCGGEYPYPTLAAMTLTDVASAVVAGTEDGEEGPGTTCTAFKATSSAFYGDPADIGSTPVNPVGATFTPTLAVPEPGSLALVGLGLLGAAALLRRKRRAD